MSKWIGTALFLLCVTEQIGATPLMTLRASPDQLAQEMFNQEEGRSRQAYEDLKKWLSASPPVSARRPLALTLATKLLPSGIGTGFSTGVCQRAYLLLGALGIQEVLKTPTPNSELSIGEAWQWGFGLGMVRRLEVDLLAVAWKRTVSYLRNDGPTPREVEVDAWLDQLMSVDQSQRNRALQIWPKKVVVFDQIPQSEYKGHTQLDYLLSVFKNKIILGRLAVSDIGLAEQAAIVRALSILKKNQTDFKARQVMGNRMPWFPEYLGKMKDNLSKADLSNPSLQALSQAVEAALAGN